jgi:hypothetical protein
MSGGATDTAKFKCQGVSWFKHLTLRLASFIAAVIINDIFSRCNVSKHQVRVPTEFLQWGLELNKKTIIFNLQLETT